MSDVQAKLDRVLRELDAADYYNGGQTRVARYPLGSDARAQLVAEAQLYADLLAAETHESPAQPSEEN